MWASLILNTGWSAGFTTEIIKPIPASSPFHSFLDITKFTFYGPIPSTADTFIEDPSSGAVFPAAYNIFVNLGNSKIEKIAEMVRSGRTFPNLGVC